MTNTLLCGKLRSVCASNGFKQYASMSVHSIPCVDMSRAASRATCVMYPCETIVTSFPFFKTCDPPILNSESCVYKKGISGLKVRMYVGCVLFAHTSVNLYALMPSLGLSTIRLGNDNMYETSE